MEIIKQEFERFMRRLEATEKIDAGTRDRLLVAFKFGVLTACEHTIGTSKENHDK